MGRAEGRVWPDNAQSEISEGHRVLGACRPSSGALPLWFSDVELQASCAGFQEEQVQAGEGGVLASFKCSGQPGWLCLSSQPWTATALMLTLREGPMEKEKNVRMESAQKNTCLSFWGNVLGEVRLSVPPDWQGRTMFQGSCLLIGEEEHFLKGSAS